MFVIESQKIFLRQTDRVELIKTSTSCQLYFTKVLRSPIKLRLILPGGKLSVFSETPPLNYFLILRSKLFNRLSKNKLDRKLLQILPKNLLVVLPIFLSVDGFSHPVRPPSPSASRWHSRTASRQQLCSPPKLNQIKTCLSFFEIKLSFYLLHC